MQMESWSPSGLQNVSHLRWGSHLAHFFGAGTELRDLLVPYFKAGLENNERCLWVTGEAFTAEQARSALRAAVSDLDKRERNEQIEIADGEKWYSAGEKLRPSDLVSGLVQREQDAMASGYDGLRTSGNCAWVSPDQWADFQEYERLVQATIPGRRMICICNYCMDGLREGSHLEVMECHDLAVPSVRSGQRRLDMRTGSLGLSPMHLLHRAGQCADDMFQRGAPEDVTPRQLAVLLAVAKNEGVNQNSLVEATGIDRSTMADIVRRLVKRELLKRRRTRKDTRAYAVKLTDKGREVLRTVAPLGERVDQRILDVLPASSRRQFLASLQTIVDTLNRADLGSKQPRA